MDVTIIDAAIDKLYELVSTRFAITQPDVDVLDGPSIDDVGQDVVAIGISADENSMDSDLQIADLGGGNMETFDLVNMVRSWTGDDDLPQRRARALELMREVAEIIRDNPRLDRTVARARVRAISYQPTRLPEGAVATVTFRVRIEAFTG